MEEEEITMGYLVDIDKTISHIEPIDVASVGLVDKVDEKIDTLIDILTNMLYNNKYYDASKTIQLLKELRELKGQNK